MNQKITLLLLLLIPFMGISQESTPTPSKQEKKSLKKARPTFLKLSLGLNSSKFRDFATSPLIYKGQPLAVSLDRLKADKLGETEWGIAYSFGNYKISVGDNTASSQVKTVGLSYSKLYSLPNFRTEKLTIKVGGFVNTTGNIRINTALQNNGFGSEIFSTVFASGKVERDISRKAAKDKKFIFIKYHLKPRKRDLSFRLNLGLINSTYRNGFVYADQSSILNTPNLFGGYSFKVFSGFRMSSALDYRIQLNDKNAVQFTYLWDAYKSGGDLDQFEMAHHIYKFSLLFNIR